MRNARRCPKCQGQRFWTFPQVELPNREHGQNHPILVVLLARGGPGFQPTGIASMEAWICAQCGYTEWYTDPRTLNATIAKLGPQSLSGVFWVDASGG